MPINPTHSHVTR